MSKCKNCKSPLMAEERFCGKCGQPVAKSRLSQPIKILIILLIILLLGIIIWTQRIGISRLTGGKLFGFHTRQIAAEEMDGEIEPPTEEEQEEFLAYVADLEAYGESKLWGDEKTLYQELNALFVMLTDCATGDTVLSLDTIEEEFDKRLKDVKAEQSIFGNLFADASITVKAAEPEDIIIDQDAYLASMLKNSASTLFLQGYDDLSLAMASMAAALAPNDSSMANLLGNILKEYGMTDTSYEMLHYALRVNPNDEAALHSLGMLCIDMGEYEEAERCFNRMLRLSDGKGPANQGWMLLALAEGDLPSAYLYMLEGAREGYTHTITEVYEAFRMRSDYFDIAGPIFDQYPLYELVRFERTQQVFDATLDTIEQQVVIDRKLKVCHDAFGSIPAQAENLLESKRYGEEMLALIVENFMGYMSTLEGELAMAKDLITDPDLAKLLDGDVSAIWALKDKYSVPEKDPNVYTYSYEQEIFYLNILQDYLEYNLEKNDEKYWQAALDKLNSEAPGNPLADFMINLEEYMEETDEYLSGLEERANSNNIYTMLNAMVEMLSWFMKNVQTNDNPMLEAEFTREEYAYLNKAMQEVAPLLEQGYMEQAILCEEYYLYTNNILGYIANDKIYNEWRFYQQLNVQTALLTYPMTATAYNGTMALGATMVWGSAAPQGDSDIHMPATPKFPVTGMGSPTGEPVLIWEYEPPPSEGIRISAEKLWEDAIKSDPTIEDQKEPAASDSGDGPVEQSIYEPGTLIEEEGFTEYKPPNTVEPELYISLDPENNKPAEATTMVTEDVNSPSKLQIKLGKLLEASIDPVTGEIALGASAILGGGKVSVNYISKEVTLYGHAGPDLDMSVKIGEDGGPMAINFGAAKVGGYGRIVLNLSKAEITSAEFGADVGVNIGGFGVETEVGYDLAAGVKTDTASLLLGTIKNTLSTKTP